MFELPGMCKLEVGWSPTIHNWQTGLAISQPDNRCWTSYCAHNWHIDQQFFCQGVAIYNWREGGGVLEKFWGSVEFFGNQGEGMNLFHTLKVSNNISYCSFFWFPSYVNKINHSTTQKTPFCYSIHDKSYREPDCLSKLTSVWSFLWFRVLF